jgi:hypothetical protein
MIADVMSWFRFVVTVLVGGFLSSLSDWLFMGDLLYRRFNQHPEIWRHVGGKGESTSIAWSSPLPLLTVAVFVLVCVGFHVHSLGATVKLAIAIWLIAPLPLLITNALFIKLQPSIAASYAVGWLVKLLVSAAAVTWILR